MSHCIVNGCKTSSYNRTPGISMHACPRNPQMRKKWLILLKNKCSMLDWNTSRICSKHFEHKYFDSARNLKETAIPTMFPFTNKSNVESPQLKTKMDRLLNQMSQSQLMNDIKFSTMKLREPLNLSEYLTDDVQSKSDAPLEAKLWLIIKKQEHLNSRLLEFLATQKKSLENCKESKKEMERNLDSTKYIVKCLQEKQATLEEQIEILTAVESRQ